LRRSVANLTEALLKHPDLYLMSQRMLGVDRARRECVASLEAQPGARILDIGCGPAYYIDRLPAGVSYVGFDTDPSYIAWAKANRGDRGEFFCDVYNEQRRLELGSFDGVLMMGLLHHLDDAEAEEALSLASLSLKPGGRLLTLDTCYDDRLTGVETWMAHRDRGEYVRSTETFRQLGSRHFADVDGRLLSRSRLPMRLWLMRLEGPITQTG
jgi:SAM-dependent methyltransferase